MDQLVQLQRKTRLPTTTITTRTSSSCDDSGDDEGGTGGKHASTTTTTTTTSRRRRMIMVVLIIIILMLSIIVLKFQIWVTTYYGDTKTTRSSSSSSSTGNAIAKNITTTTTTTKTGSSATTTTSQQQHPPNRPQQQQQQKRPKPSKIIYSNIRHDRSGAAIQDMLMCHAYVYHLNKQQKQNRHHHHDHGHHGAVVYGGACGESIYIDSYRHLINGIGLSEMLPFACPNTNTTTSSSSQNNIPYEIIVDRSTYQTPEDIRIFTLDYIRHVQQKYILPYFQKQQKEHEQQQQQSDNKNNNNNPYYDYDYYDYIIAVHVRRGDITPCCWETRYLPNLHYIQLIQRSVEKITRSSSSAASFSSGGGGGVAAGANNDDVDKTTRNIRLRVVIFSESNNNSSTSVESFDDFRNMKFTTSESMSSLSKIIQVHVDVDIILDGDPIEVWKTMIVDADICILSKSSFSLVPAIFNIQTTQRAAIIMSSTKEEKAAKGSTTTTTTTTTDTTTTTTDSSTRGHILYTPPYIHRPLQYWDIVDDSQLKQQSKKIVNKLKKQHCSGIKCNKRR